MECIRLRIKGTITKPEEHIAPQMKHDLPLPGRPKASSSCLTWTSSEPKTQQSSAFQCDPGPKLGKEFGQNGFLDSLALPDFYLGHMQGLQTRTELIVVVSGLIRIRTERETYSFGLYGVQHAAYHTCSQKDIAHLLIDMYPFSLMLLGGLEARTSTGKGVKTRSPSFGGYFKVSWRPFSGQVTMSQVSLQHDELAIVQDVLV